MTAFWIMTALLASLAALIVLGAARKGAEAVEAGGAAANAGAELAELDRLRDRGLLDEPSWTAARAEAARRLLSAEREARTPVAGRNDRHVLLAGLAVAGLGVLGLYSWIGRPGLSDQAYAARVDDWASRPEQLEPAQIAAVVAREVARRPNDQQALTMLGAARFEAGDPIGAVSAFRRAVALRPDDAQSWARLGESLVRADQGRVGGDAEAAFREALELDPGQLGARYFLGEAALVRGEGARVRELWLPLIAALGPDDPRRAALQRRLPGGAG